MTDDQMKLYGVIALAGLGYLGVGFRVCKFWMGKEAKRVKPCPRAGCSWGCECIGFLPAAVLSVPLWPVHIPILAAWGLGWCIWKPFDVMWRRTKWEAERANASKEYLDSLAAKSVLIAASPKRHITATAVKDMTEDEYFHWMECEVCRVPVTDDGDKKCCVPISP